MFTFVPDSRADTRTDEPFPDRLAQEAADLCRRLSEERELELAHARAQLQEERDHLKAENVRLQSELTAHKAAAHYPAAEQPQASLSSKFFGVGQQTEPLKEFQAAAGASFEKDFSADESQGQSMRQAFQLAVISSDHIGAADSNLFVLRKVYRDLDRRKMGRVCAQDIVARTQRRFQGNKIPDLQDTIQEINRQLAKRMNRGSKQDLDAYPLELTFEGFQFLILQRNLEESVPAAVAATIREVREFYVTWTTEVMILEKTRVEKDELDENLSKDKVPFWLEPTIGVLILLNALSIGISQDIWQNSPLWTIVETVFSVFFFLELVIKLFYVGWSEHFFGPAFVWNWFDLCIVVIALVGICLDAFSDKSELNTLTVIRLIRLVRMARLVRLLRMKVFKELALMVNGVIGGLKTLFWAFVFLIALIFILGVFMRQMVTDSCNDVDMWTVDVAGNQTLTEATCFVKENHKMLFSSVFRSMFTVFRCVIGDCTDKMGQPIAVELMEHFGHTFTVLYVSVICFVLFGVFNLIAAIFVENTLEAARVSQQKRQQARTKEHIRVAQELKEIVLRICKRDKRSSSSLQEPFECGGRKVGGLNCLRKSIKSKFGRSSRKSTASGASDDPDDIEIMEMAVSRPVFEQVMQEPAVLDIMEDLEINVTDRSKLFDIIDSNGSGSLDVGEIIEGLMKLRGPADKGDIVCASLMVRSVQRDLHRLDAEMHERHRIMYESQQELERTQARMLRGLQERGFVIEDSSSRNLNTGIWQFGKCSMW